MAARLADFDVVVAMRERTPFPRTLLDRLPSPPPPRHDRHAQRVHRSPRGGRSGRPRLRHGRPALPHGRADVGAHPRPGPPRAAGGPGDPGAAAGRKPSAPGSTGRPWACSASGTLGSRVARIGRAFEMNVVAWSQNLTAERAAAVGASLVARDELLAEADVVTIHLVLSERTRGLLGARELALMRKTAYLVNTSRGPIVEEPALIHALEAGAIAGAGPRRLRRGAAARGPPVPPPAQHRDHAAPRLRDRGDLPHLLRRGPRGRAGLPRGRAGTGAAPMSSGSVVVIGGGVIGVTVRLLPRARRVGRHAPRQGRDLRGQLLRERGADRPEPRGAARRARRVVAGRQVDAASREPLLHQAAGEPRARAVALAVSGGLHPGPDAAGDAAPPAPRRREPGALPRARREGRLRLRLPSVGVDDRLLLGRGAGARPGRGAAPRRGRRRGRGAGRA